MNNIYPSTYRDCVDWSQIDKNEYLSAMRESVADSTHIKALVQPALTTKINTLHKHFSIIDLGGECR